MLCSFLTINDSFIQCHMGFSLLLKKLGAMKIRPPDQKQKTCLMLSKNMTELRLKAPHWHNKYVSLDVPPKFFLISDTKLSYLLVLNASAGCLLFEFALVVSAIQDHLSPRLLSSFLPHCTYSLAYHRLIQIFPHSHNTLC